MPPACDPNEAVTILREYLRINTTNPPGGELAAARFLAGILERAGIPFQIYESAPGRANLVARLKGSGAARPLILLNHMDVVGVEPQHWEVDAFSGLIKDGFIWGRGALDMKGMAIMELMALLRLRRENAPLSRDIIFLAMADEEQAGVLGMQWMAEHHPRELEAEYALNECSFGVSGMTGLSAPLFPISVAEKTPLWMRISLQGEAGHASMPPTRHAPHRLVRVLDRLLAMRRPAVLTPEVLAMLHAIGARTSSPLTALILRNIHRPPVWMLCKRLLMRDKSLRPLLSHRVSINILHSGQKINVVPSTAEAAIDLRLMPGADPAAYARRVRRALRLSTEELSVTLQGESGSTPVDTPMYAALSNAIRQAYPEAVITPALSSGFSDARFLRARGVKVYGICPALIPQTDIESVHGHNERIGVQSFLTGIDIVHAAVRAIAA